jgi:hypothetical protein
LTLQRRRWKSNGTLAMQPDLYARWRALARGATLREGGEAPPEKLLQAVWLHQRLRRAELRATDGRPVRVLHPGFWNRAAGPDFQRAAIQFGDEPPRFGDIEVDVAPAAWRAHGHDRNAAFQDVILHVVWRGATGGAKSPLPTLELADALDAPLAQLDDWLGGEPAIGFPESLRGRCSAPLRDLSDDLARELLQQAARVRLRAKAAAFTTRAQSSGWEQALWEGVFASLGYQHNVWPFRRLAELLPSLPAGKAPASVTAWQARLLGLAGLLPEELPRHAAAARHVRLLWDYWWRERDALAGLVLPRKLWRLQGLRPANHPARRLALAAHWWARGELPARLEQWFEHEAATRRPADSLLKLLAVERDEFWSWHLALSSARAAKPLALIGAPRVGDLAVNVILPWLHARAQAGRRKESVERVERLYFAWPAGEDNAVLKLARQRLLGARPAQRLDTAAAQQGLLQIVRDFCAASNSLCEGCRFPDLVRQTGGEVYGK